jgi:hypothetical protein
MSRVALEAVRGSAGWGIRVVGSWVLEQLRPVAVVAPGSSAAGRATGYGRWLPSADGGTGVGRIRLAGDAWAEVEDCWSVRDDVVHVRRALVVRGAGSGAFGSRLSLRRRGWTGSWADLSPFVPGVAYGDATRVAEGALGGLPARRAGVRAVLIREDRMAAPLVAVRYADGAWCAILHADVRGGTVDADCTAVDGGETLVDGRLDYAALGGVVVREPAGALDASVGEDAEDSELEDATDGALELGLWFPGSEGEYTYSTGGLPLTQPRAWRRRYHPVRDGARQTYALAIRLGTEPAADALTGLDRSAATAWRWAWETLAPHAAPVDLGLVRRSVLDVCAERVVTVGGRTGVPIEADAVCALDPGCATSCVMGFVGAATDVGYLLLREGDARGPSGAPLRERGTAILDTFAALPLDPPAGEGFDTATGDLVTYRTLDGRAAVFARSLAEGALAMLRAVRLEQRRGAARPLWDVWWRNAAGWLIRAQDADGGLPRAWEAGTGQVLDPSRSSSAVVVPFLAAGAAEGAAGLLDAAVAAGEHAWAEAERTGCFAGATLDNPDVVDKEAAVLAAEAFCDLHDATGAGVWLERALVAARLAETWTYLWDVPMPVDADPADLHWKPGVPTTGHQLITTGASMTDGFLAVNAVVFARLWRATGDPHWLEVARLVTYGTTAMLALPGRTFDLRGVGWQQEHWCFGGRRGRGLNRRWLPWVAVAHALGAARLADAGLAADVLGAAS